MPRPIRAAYTIPAGAQFGAPRANGTRIHQGCDYHCPIGTPIYGTGPGGVVTHIGYNGDPNTGSGHNITVIYPGSRITIDMHMREASPLRVGSTVNEHTILGYVGITGNAVNASPPGSHDHHQLTINGKLVDPEVFYGTTTAGESGTPISEDEEEEDDMKFPMGIIWTGSDGKSYAAQYYPPSGFFSKVQGSQALYNAMNVAGIPFFGTTESHAKQIEADCAKVRSRAA